ncbi:hypothetical protein LLEC1_08124 [Akanthomyces lecanii]|uniref:7-dehydrocholesterol reductase n=1 Tax=Cordyceps confragosa TaxID=2714763 RepID=A0A179IV31_CORDF|nr:hypothetical protein LLEC1_08124 [Akanthomyces lecanii]
MAAMPGIVAPIFSIVFFIVLAEFDGCISYFLTEAYRRGFGCLFTTYSPRLTKEGLIAVFGWVAVQAALFQWLPGPMNTGQQTPAGYIHSYRTNGLTAWVVTHDSLAALCWCGVVDAGFIPRNWSGLVAAMNLAGFLVSAFTYLKGCFFPTYSEDRAFSGSILYDFYIGVKLNPQVGTHFNFKLFSNGRPGIVAWTLIYSRDLSNLFYQYQNESLVQLTLLLITILHTIYIINFFINES